MLTGCVSGGWQVGAGSAGQGREGGAGEDRESNVGQGRKSEGPGQGRVWQSRAGRVG